MGKLLHYWTSWLSVCLPVCVSVGFSLFCLWVSVCLFVGFCLTVGLDRNEPFFARRFMQSIFVCLLVSVSLSVLAVCVGFSLSVCWFLSVCPSVCRLLLVCLLVSVCQSVCLSVCLYLCSYLSMRDWDQNQENRFSTYVTSMLSNLMLSMLENDWSFSNFGHFLSKHSW